MLREKYKNLFLGLVASVFRTSAVNSTIKTALFFLERLWQSIGKNDTSRDKSSPSYKPSLTCTVSQTEISGVVHGEHSCRGCISRAVLLWPLTASPEHLWKQDRSRVHLKKDKSTQGGFMHRYHILTGSHNVTTIAGSTALLGWYMEWMEEIIISSHAFQIHLI